MDVPLVRMLASYAFAPDGSTLVLSESVITEPHTGSTQAAEVSLP
jgi:hypothetical protein